MKIVRMLVVTMTLGLGIYAVGCGGNDKNPTNPGGGGGGTADKTINITGQNGSSSFDPSPDTVSVGQTVSWHNLDATAHTATSNATGAGAFGTGTIGGGATSTPIAMNTAGSFAYRCTIHPTMTGVLVVQ